MARDRAVRLVTLARLAVMFTSGGFLVVEPLYARHVRRLVQARASVLSGPRAVAAAAAGYGLAAALFAGTRWVPVAYCGAFAWGVAGAVFYSVAAATVQRRAPAGPLGRVTGVISTGESATEAVSLPLAGALVALAGIRPAALILAAVAVAVGMTGLAGTIKHNQRATVDLPSPRPCIGAGGWSSVPVKGNFPGFR